jgi:hypothetical protein
VRIGVVLVSVAQADVGEAPRSSPNGISERTARTYPFASSSAIACSGPKVSGAFVGGLALMKQRWFWVLVFFVAGLASCFAMLASIIHFQILGAVSFFFLMAFCWGFAGGIAGAGN